MIIRLDYGMSGLDVNLPDDLDVTIVESKYAPGLPDPRMALIETLRRPIGLQSLDSLVNTNDKVGVIFSDVTRPMPSHLIIPTILEELAHVPRENITLYNALGTHRPNTETELCQILGNDLVNGYRIIQNDSLDRSTQINLGITSRGHDIWINRDLIECDVKILTGFIEPHFFAGFSGGGKAVMPGMAGRQTILENHGVSMIDDPNATWGITWGNPIWEEIHEVTQKIGQTFLVNVTLNRNKQISGVFSGELYAAHAAGIDFVKETAMIPVSHPFDIVITSNSGYPLDLNLYQSVKGMSAAAEIVREGGAIIIATDCWDGIPEHGLYGQLLREVDSPQALLKTICTPGFLKQDQWQAQIQAQILLTADVYVRTDHLTNEQVEMALLRPSPNIEETVSELIRKYGSEARICVLPEGPQTIPYIHA